MANVERMGSGTLPVRQRPAIVGVADYVPRKGETSPDYWVQAARVALAALNDAGLTPRDVDGVVFTYSGYTPFPAFVTNFCEYLGIQPAWMENSPHGGAQRGSMMWRAALGILSGLAKTVLIVASDNREQRLSRGGVVNRIAEHNTNTQFEYPYGPIFPSQFALFARRHMHEYGTTSEQLASVAVAQRTWAGLHPQARSREPITVQDVLQSRMISSPLHLLDICPINNGGGAAVMVGGERAYDLCPTPVHLLGFGDYGESQSITFLPDFTDTRMLRMAADHAIRMAGISRDEIDIVYPYDPSTFHVIWALEELGFCKRGEAGAFVESGATRPGGALPANTHGGLLSYLHPGGGAYFLGMIEGVRQLRGVCGERQVPNAARFLGSAMGGFMTVGVNVFGKEV